MLANGPGPTPRVELTVLGPLTDPKKDLEATRREVRRGGGSGALGWLSAGCGAQLVWC